mmetsp:Transcript_20129/g.30202  ORF Transcript_20129/g.30202 Transcript_20129/m.30202 type:complete len:267 (-) Transcript_20129:44-844(-)
MYLSCYVFICIKFIRRRRRRRTTTTKISLLESENSKSDADIDADVDADADASCGQGQGQSPAVVLLSGDVHHAEILDSSEGLKQNDNWNHGDGRIIEVTSSGLTHSCIDPFYGPLCAPILETFPNHRHESIKNYYTGRNFGSIEIQWGDNDEQQHDDKDKKIDPAKGGGEDSMRMSKDDMMEINVHNVHGEKVLSTGLHPLCMFGSHMTEEQLENVIGVDDGHLIPYLKKFVAAVLLFVLLYKRMMIRLRYTKNVHQTKVSKKKTV